jgi:CubicO group peptidase (beta-lactamase class C family)
MNLDERFNISTPEEQGVPSSSILEFIDVIEARKLELHSIMLIRHGNIVTQGWWKPYSKERKHSIFSISKSFTSTAIGLAIYEKLISIDDKVISFFPDDLPDVISKNLKQMSIKHLLTMTTGHEYISFNLELRLEKENWVQSFLAEPVKYEPGTHFYYNNAATYLLSAIIHKVTSMTLMEYLEPLLLGPLGIVGATWDKCPHGINIGAWGLRIKTEDIAAFGQMYLNKGIWEGKRIVPETWIEAASSWQVPNSQRVLVGLDENDGDDWAQGYGYNFWRCTHGSYRADGAFGQLCLVMPKQDVVMVMTSGLESDNFISVLNDIWSHLYDKMESAAIPLDNDSYEKLQKRLANLSLSEPLVSIDSPIIKVINGGIFVATEEFINKDFENNKDQNNKDSENNEIIKLDIDKLSFQFENDKCLISYMDNNGGSSLICGLREPFETTGRLFNKAKDIVIAMGIWINRETFYINLKFIETPYNEKITCIFEDEKIILKKQICLGDDVIENYIFEGVLDIKEYY